MRSGPVVACGPVRYEVDPHDDKGTVPAEAGTVPLSGVGVVVLGCVSG